MTKYYVVRKGRIPGIYNSWNECKEQTDKFSGAEFKSFTDEAEANEYLLGYLPKDKIISYDVNSVNCDGGYSSSTGIMDFNVRDTKTGELLLNKTYHSGTNNLAEFLAVVNAIAYLRNNNLDRKTVIYTDSVTALSWVRDKKIKTTFDLSSDSVLEQEVSEALEFLKREPDYNYIVKKWDTINWGEIPSDFGRK